MIEFLKGTLVEKSPTSISIDCNGVGYLVNISLNTYSKIADSGPVKVLTHLSIKEDAHTLYGFAEESERKLFRHLISVNGIGANSARMILSSLLLEELQGAILSGNVVLLTKIKGVGSKTAQRIILDLRDKLAKGDNNAQILTSPNNTAREEALSALITLGFARNTVEKALDQILKNNQGLAVEALIKMALQSL